MLVRRPFFEGAERGERSVGAGAVLALSLHSAGDVSSEWVHHPTHISA